MITSDNSIYVNDLLNLDDFDSLDEYVFYLSRVDEEMRNSN